MDVVVHSHMLTGFTDLPEGVWRRSQNFIVPDLASSGNVFACGSQGSILSYPRDLFRLHAVVVVGGRFPFPHLRLSFTLSGPLLEGSLWERCAFSWKARLRADERGWREPEREAISTITCAHVTALAPRPCGVNRSSRGIIAAFLFQLEKA